MSESFHQRIAITFLHYASEIARHVGRAMVAGCLLALLLALSTSPRIWADELTSFEERVQFVYDKVRPSVVRIAYENDRGGETPCWTGVIVTPEGHLLTVSLPRVADGEKLIVYLPGGRRVSGTALGWSEEFDVRLAQLDEAGPWPHVAINSSVRADAGQACVGLSYTYRHGLDFDPEPALFVGEVRLSTRTWFSSTCKFGDFGEAIFDLEGRPLGVTSVRDVYALAETKDSVHTRVDAVSEHWDLLVAGENLDQERLSTESHTAIPGTRPVDSNGSQRLERAQSATVRVQPQGGRSSSGVVISPDGYVATTAHGGSTGVARLPGEDVTVIFPDGRKAAARVLGSQRVADYCLIKISDAGPWPYVETGNSFEANVGGKCRLLGYPANYTGNAPLVREGTVAQREGFVNTCHLHSSMENHRGGDSGGGVFDAKYRLIAVHNGAVGTVAKHARIELFKKNWAELVSEEAANVTDQEPLSEMQSAFRTLSDEARESVVTILDDGRPVALGIVVGSDGLILTKSSELYGPLSCRLPDGRTLSAVVKNEYPEHDLAVLRIKADGLPVARLHRSKATAPGTLVAAVLPDETQSLSAVAHMARQIPAERGTLLPTNFLYETDRGLEIRAESPEILAAFLRGTPLRPGDLLVAVEGHATPDLESYRALLSGDIQLFAQAGAPIRATVERGDERLELRFPLRGSYAPRPTYQSRRCSGFAAAFDVYMPLRPQQCGAPLIDKDGLVTGIAIAHRAHGQIHSIPVQAFVASILGEHDTPQ